MAAFAVVFEAGLLRVSRRKHPSGASAVYVDAAYRSADQMTRLRPIIRTADAGMRSNAFLRRSGSPPAMARVVGKTGAMERPAMKTRAAAATGLTVRSIRKVVMAMAMEAARRTW